MIGLKLINHPLGYFFGINIPKLAFQEKKKISTGVRKVISPLQGIKIDGEKPYFCYPIKFVLSLFNNQ